MEGGLFSNPRVEIFLDQAATYKEVPYVLDYYAKVKESTPPPFYVKYMTHEFHIRKFPSKDSREQFNNMLKEAMHMRVWMKPIVA